MELKNIIELGALAAVFIFFVKEFFTYLKAKKTNGNGKDETFSQAILGELQKMNSNHLHSIQECVETGNSALIKTIHDDNIQMIQLLGEIKGILSVK